MSKSLFLIMLFATVLQATKPSVPLKPQIQRADTVVIATALNSCTYCKDNNRARFRVIEMLKGVIRQNNIAVTTPYLSFDRGTKYILFLQKKEKHFQWINGKASRLIATEKNVKDGKNILRP